MVKKLPTVYHIKPAFQELLRPLTRLLARLGVSANQVTLVAGLMSLIVGGLVAFEGIHAVLWVPAALFFRMALNAIDGMLAREHGMKSNLGAILNELTDVFSDAVLYLPFGVLPGLSFAVVSWIVILSVISEMTGVVAIQIGASRRYDGPMGKSDRALVFGGIALLLGLGVHPGVWIAWVMRCVFLLLMVTIYNRAAHALAEAKG